MTLIGNEFQIPKCGLIFLTVGFESIPIPNPNLFFLASTLNLITKNQEKLAKSRQKPNYKTKEQDPSSDPITNNNLRVTASASYKLYKLP